MDIKTAFRVVSDAITTRTDLSEIGRLAIEDMLVELRDCNMSVLRHGGGNNGLVIRGKDGSSSSIIRMSPDLAVRIAINAILEHLERS
jgi:hypothetical protein